MDYYLKLLFIKNLKNKKNIKQINIKKKLDFVRGFVFQLVLIKFDVLKIKFYQIYYFLNLNLFRNLRP